MLLCHRRGKNSSHSSSAPAWGPSHGPQSFMKLLRRGSSLPQGAVPLEQLSQRALHRPQPSSGLHLPDHGVSPARILTFLIEERKIPWNWPRMQETLFQNEDFWTVTAVSGTEQELYNCNDYGIFLDEIISEDTWTRAQEVWVLFLELSLSNMAVGKKKGPL
ncbi:uncharacterized protein VSU04_001319 [Chlamydotis macqueenii]